MTGIASLFQKYSPHSEGFIVRTADGSISKIAGIRSIALSKDLVLKSILLVPKLTSNLLSISKITRDLNCVTNFYQMHCEFQDLESRRTIGDAKENAGLYTLEVPNNPEK